MAFAQLHIKLDNQAEVWHVVQPCTRTPCPFPLGDAQTISIWYKKKPGSSTPNDHRMLLSRVDQAEYIAIYNDVSIMVSFYDEQPNGQFVIIASGGGVARDRW